MSKPILVDCDGVLSNLAHAVCMLAAERAGIYKGEAEITDYDFGQAFGWCGWRREVEQATLHREFVYRMRPYSGAFLFLRQLEQQHGRENVFVCTKPWEGLPDWLSQRAAWLKDFACVPIHRQIHISEKRLVPGLLLDDDPRNFRDRPFHDCYLIARPWNVGAPFTRGTLAEAIDLLVQP